MNLDSDNIGANGLKRAWVMPICALFLSGCVGGSDDLAGSGSTSTGVVDKTRGAVATVITGGQGPIEVDPNAFTADVYCPPIQLLPNTHFISKYERGKEGEPKALLYHASIEEWARSCKRVGTDQTSIKLGLSGKATPGPAWKGGEVKLPVRVALIAADGDGSPFKSEIVSVPVPIEVGSPSEAWTVVEEKYTVERNREMKIVFGFDEGKKGRR